MGCVHACQYESFPRTVAQNRSRNRGAYLGYCLVVDVDQVAGRGVHLEGLVEGEGGIKRLGSCVDKESVSSVLRMDLVE
jgi:hypothetical protein